MADPSSIELNPNAFLTVRAAAAMFVALGGTIGVKRLLHAATLLEGLSRDKSLDESTRAQLNRLVAAADANVVAEITAPEPAE